MKFNIFYGLFVFTLLLLLSSFSSAQNLESVSNKEKISFTNIKYLDTIQNTKPAEGIPEVDVDYWMKTVFDGIKDVKDGKGYQEFEDTLSAEYLKIMYNLEYGTLKNNISASITYYYTIKKEPHAVILFQHVKEIPAVVLQKGSNISLKSYEFDNATMSILELQFKEDKWNLKKHTENLRNCISVNQSLNGNGWEGWNFDFLLPRVLSLESGHHFIVTELRNESRYFENQDTSKLFSNGNFETSAIAWESLNEFSFKDYDSYIIEGILSYFTTFRGVKPYKKEEKLKFFIDKGILHAEISQDGFIHDKEKDKMIPQNAKSYYRYSEEKKIFTKLN